jgi:hypothetical protein
MPSIIVNVYDTGICSQSARPLALIMEIGLEQAPFVVFVYFFPHLNMQKNLMITGYNNTKNSSNSVIYSYLTMNNIVRILLLL